MDLGLGFRVLGFGCGAALLQSTRTRRTRHGFRVYGLAAEVYKVYTLVPHVCVCTTWTWNRKPNLLAAAVKTLNPCDT